MEERPTPSARDLASLQEGEIPHHLKGLDESEFIQLRENPHFQRRHAIAILRDHSIPGEVIRRIHDDEELMADYRVKASIALHPHAPKIIAMAVLRQLFWRDLLMVIASLKVHPQIRRNAEHILSEQIDDLTLGEQVAMARMATRSVIRMLRTSRDARVVQALLENSRVTEEDVLFLASRGESRPDILRVVGRAPRWAARYPVRLALVRNPGTPPAISLGFLSSLKEPDLQGLVHTSSVPYVVRRTAERILSEGRKHQS